MHEGYQESRQIFKLILWHWWDTVMMSSRGIWRGNTFHYKPNAEAHVATLWIPGSQEQNLNSSLYMINRTCSITLLLSSFHGNKSVQANHRGDQRITQPGWCVHRTLFSFPGLAPHSTSITRYSLYKPPEQNEDRSTCRTKCCFYSQGILTPSHHKPLHIYDTILQNLCVFFKYM